MAKSMKVSNFLAGKAMSAKSGTKVGARGKQKHSAGQSPSMSMAETSTKTHSYGSRKHL